MRATGMTIIAMLLIGGCNVDEQRNEGEALEAELEANRPAPAAPMAPPTPTPAATSTTTAALPTDAWLGRWIGVEGLNLTIAPTADGAPGRYALTMQYTLDDAGTFEGRADGDVIRFTRPDGEQTLRASDGDATGLKWLAGKQDCLTVQTGEGYCRD